MKAKILILIAACSFGWSMNSNSQTMPGEIKGTVTDSLGNTLPGASISYTVNGTLQAAIADENGSYRIKPLEPGSYEITFSYLGFRKEIRKDIQVRSGLIVFVSVKLGNDNTLPPVEIIDYQGLYEKGEVMVVTRLDAKQIENSPVRELRNIVGTTPGAGQKDDGKEINIRGSRADATQYYIDGIKMIGSFDVPQSAIKEIAVISGGVPAMYGDAMGGVVLITTKSYWDRQ